MKTSKMLIQRPLCIAVFATLPMAVLAQETIKTSSSPANAEARRGEKGESNAPVTEKIEVVSQPEPYAPPRRVSSTKTDVPVRLTPQSIQVVPSAILSEQKAITLTDAIRNVSGVTTDFGFNGSAQPLLILRGFPSASMSARSSMSGSSTYYVDGNQIKGVPLNMADVQAVEVVKGPASVLYGRSEPGGLVNVVRRPLSAVTKFGMEQTVGQNDLTRTIIEATGSLNTDKTLLGRANLSYSVGGSPRAFVVNRLGALSTTIGWLPSTTTSITASLNMNDQRYRTDFGSPVVGNRPLPPRDTLQYNDSPELSRIKSDTISVTAEHRVDARWKVKLHLLSQRADTKEVDVTPYRLDLTTFDDCAARTPAQMCRSYFYARPDGRVKLDQATLDVTGKFKAMGVEHSMLATIDTYRYEKTGETFLQVLPSVDFFNPTFGNTPRLERALSSVDQRDDRSQWTSLTIQNQIAFGNGLHAVLALRRDQTEAIYAASDTEPTNKINATSPRLGLVYELTPNHSVYAQYQDSLAANNGRNPADGAALAPERAKQSEVGYKGQFMEGLIGISVALYNLEKRNLSDYSLFFTQNVLLTTGKARSRGLEWDLLGQLSPNWGVMASYAYTDTKVTEDAVNVGKRLANAPKHAGSIWTRYTAGAWSFGGGVFAQSQRQGDTGNTFQLPGYGRVDAMLAYAFRVGSGKASLQLNLNNILDRAYFTGSHQFVQDWVQVGAARNASLTLRADF